MVAEISERMSEVESENYVRHHKWDPLNAHETFEEVGKYFPGDRIPNINVSYSDLVVEVELWVGGG